MKKTVFAAVIAAMLFTFIVNCNAAGAVITVGNAKTSPGQTVEIAAKIENNPGFCYLRVRPEYDDRSLELVSAKAGEVYADTVSVGLNISIDNGSDMHGDGSILILTFRVKENVTEGRYPIALNFIECYNYDEAEVAVTVTEGYISVTYDDDGNNVITREALKSEENTMSAAPVRIPVTEKTGDGDKNYGGDKRVIVAAIVCAAAAVAAAGAVVFIKSKKK